MRDWNVVVTARERGFVMTCEVLGELGRIERTAYYNVLVMRVDDRERFLSDLRAMVSHDPRLGTFAFARVVPLARLFDFATPEAFETRAREAALGWLPQLAGRRFHVRMHRRGFKGALPSQEEERFLDRALLEALANRDTPGAIDFDDPDAILDVETVDGRAGLALWTREELERYPFLRLD